MTKLERKDKLDRLEMYRGQLDRYDEMDRENLDFIMEAKKAIKNRRAAMEMRFKSKCDILMKLTELKAELNEED